MMQKMQRFEAALGKIGERLSMPELQREPASLDEPPDLLLLPARTMNTEHLPDGRPQQAWKVVMDPECGPASIPASCVSEVPKSSSPGLDRHSTCAPDIVSRGVISLQHATALFDVYHQRLDHFLYRILGDHDGLSSVRKSSPLLTVAICAVGALHSDDLGHLYPACYGELESTVAAHLFSKESNLDDVRGLCIGAFWLSELSWTLVSTGRYSQFVLLPMSMVCLVSDQGRASCAHRFRDTTPSWDLPSYAGGQGRLLPDPRVLPGLCV